jgi:cyanophycin synthetase
MHNVQNAMFAVLMTYAMGVKVENIRQGLRTFDTTYFQAPGRLNVYDELPFKVILDYGHNPAAVRAMAALVQRLDVKGKRVCVLSAPGDRRDDDIKEIARAAAPAFDRFILREDDGLRGRSPGQITGILADELRAQGISADRITTILDEQKSIDAALALCVPGDLLLIFGDSISRCWKQIVRFREQTQPGPTRGNIHSKVGNLAMEPATSEHQARRPRLPRPRAHPRRPAEDRARLRRGHPRRPPAPPARSRGLGGQASHHANELSLVQGIAPPIGSTRAKARAP